VERVAFKVGDRCLHPASAEAIAVMGKLNVGETVAVEVYRTRHNRFATKVHFVFERIATSRGLRVRNVRGWIAAMTGRADLVEIDGDQALVAWGTGPRDMNEPEFQSFWEDSEDVIRTRILPSLHPDDAEDVIRMMARTQTGG
jgi:hypothetical protein